MTALAQGTHGGHPADFFVCDIFDAAPKTDMGGMEHPMFSLSTRPDRTIRHYARGDTRITVTPSVRGRATIHDKDILIYCISQLMAALNAGRTIARKLTLTAHDLLIATRRDTGGDSYVRLVEAFERLAGTRITTNIVTGDQETTSGFGLIEAWEIVRKSRATRGGPAGRMVSVSVTLSDWLFRAVQAKSVLTLSRDYFTLRKPLERRIYEIARKHCGQQRLWRASVATLHEKAGSDAPLRVFRAALRRMIQTNGLPDYVLSEETGDIICVTRRGMGPDQAGLAPLRSDTLDDARRMAPGMDVHALEAEWRGFWVTSGRPVLRSADAAFLGWLKGRVTR
ncbi:Replication initiator protein A [Loktanella fryxellensis]|uniref:Replication initiator protein A n=1 Tax=Loktanella fryxellensis TaxID=245187 RepID=A0A1H8GWE8_9RHOB|nr:replication initiator protein A [Loktanella fryxellensis]SEN48140.1 Replication initiator protein A [Loktanella fryxellensis]